MKVTASELANGSNKVIDLALRTGEAVEIQRHGRTVAELHPKVGATRNELIRLFQDVRFTAAERKELTEAMDAASDMVGYAGGN